MVIKFQLETVYTTYKVCFSLIQFNTIQFKNFI